MKKETEAKLYELLDYLTNTLKYYSKNDDHWKISLSLTRHTAKELIPIVEKELESEEE
jgi:hypothetical protein